MTDNMAKVCEALENMIDEAEDCLGRDAYLDGTTERNTRNVAQRKANISEARAALALLASEDRLSIDEMADALGTLEPASLDPEEIAAGRHEPPAEQGEELATLDELAHAQGIDGPPDLGKIVGSIPDMPEPQAEASVELTTHIPEDMGWIRSALKLCPEGIHADRAREAATRIGSLLADTFFASRPAPTVDLRIGIAENVRQDMLGVLPKETADRLKTAHIMDVWMIVYDHLKRPAPTDEKPYLANMRKP